MRWSRVGVCLALVAATLAAPVSAQSSPTGGAASPLPTAASADWVFNVESTAFLTAPDESSDVLATLKPLTYLQVTGYDGEFAHVLVPRTGQTGYVSSYAIGPTDPPPDFVTAAPPAALDEVNLPGRIIRGASLAFYPAPDEEAQTDRLGHNAPVFIKDSVEGTDGETWYRTSDGDYLPADRVRLPRPPAREFGGRWLDADLSEPAMLTAYQNGVPVMDTLTIKGAGPRPTPTGVFSISRRVANETMNSDTIGIPRFGPGGYYLTNVLFTQYFTGDGASIHYNYWSSNWGYAGSHGCLGLTYADAAYLWNWATYGTTVYIHY
jgi:L,D-transpeptidase-like protein